METRKRYRELIARPDILVMPGVYDALSARIAEISGFTAVVAGGNAAIGSMLAGPDIGQSNMRDYADHYARVCGAVGIPVSVDADTGFGDVHNVRQMVRGFEDAGVAGIMISDQIFPNRCGYMAGKQVVPVADMVAKIKAAVDARRDADLVLIARTDAAGVNGLDDAIERAQIFIEAGADVGRPQGVDAPDEIRRVVQEVPGPAFAILSQAAGRRRLDIRDLQDLGVAAVTLPTLGLFAAAMNVARVLKRLRAENSLASVEDQLMPLTEYYALVDLEGALGRERRYHEAAVTLAARPRTARKADPSSPLGAHAMEHGDNPGIHDAGAGP